MTKGFIARGAGVLAVVLLAAGCGRDLAPGDATALHAAIAGRGSETIARFLLEHGANPLKPNARQQTPLSIAEARSTEAIATLVRAAAADAE